MKILVTGGAGFIGSHIVDLFIENGHEVIVVDNLSTGKKKNVNKKATLYIKDIRSEGLNQIFKQENPDVVCHHAAQINVRDSIENPVFDADVNVKGSINLLECCKNNNVKKVIYASSGGAIYGEPKYLPCDEKHPIKPLSPYGASKYAVELMLNYYFTAHKIKYFILRYSNVYGPRQKGGEAGVVSIFIKQMLKDKKCFINGDGKQTRDFVFVKDVARANLLALSSNENCAVNIGMGKQTSILNLFTQIKELTKYKKKEEYKPEIKGEVKKIVLENSLAKEKINWEPSINLKTGLEKTVEWFK
ncbi:MAG: L-arabinose 1-dehydrogenase (NAD(P)(+)) [Candidatus Woesearchaeota archaeon]|nr:L-arabinose 1-dehydrogenase (NAD(P)(+)) [Candidatus Woesearchaeota archaeon]